MRVLISFIILSLIKVVSLLFYRSRSKWLTLEGEKKWDKIRLIVFLNHTSLFEPLYMSLVPFNFLFRLSRKMVAPGADKTLKRPIVGKFWRIMSPGMISISRKRDDTWKEFMASIEERSVIIIAPEGRMKRPNGLDLSGKKMTVKPGISDILDNIHEGNMLIAYSGGLHHVQVPGQTIPKVFKSIHMNIEQLDIEKYKAQFKSSGRALKKDIVDDFQRRLETNCPNP